MARAEQRWLRLSLLLYHANTSPPTARGAKQGGKTAAATKALASVALLLQISIHIEHNEYFTVDAVECALHTIVCIQQRPSSVAWCGGLA